MRTTSHGPTIAGVERTWGREERLELGRLLASRADWVRTSLRGATEDAIAEAVARTWHALVKGALVLPAERAQWGPILYAYLRTTARYVAIHCRALPVPSCSDLHDPWPRIDAALEVEQIARRLPPHLAPLFDAMADLGEEHGTALTLARRLGVPVGTVYSRQHALRAMLR